MRRRDFITLGCSATAWPLAARAQQPNRVRRIGVLMPLSETDPEGKTELAAFAEQLQKLGWTEGGNLSIDDRWAAGDRERMEAFAKELVALQPDVIFARSTPVIAALLKETRTIPIVFAVVSAPVGEGFVASLARPGGNATGFTNAESSLTGKWLGLLKEIFPNANRIAFIFDPKTAPGGGLYYTKLIETAAPSFAVLSAALPVHNASDIGNAIDEFAREPNGGMIVLPDATTNLHLQLLVTLAARYRLPAVYPFRCFAEDGGLMSYGVDVAELFRSAANYVDRILRGAKPADLPVQLPEKFEFVLNLKTAKTLGLTIPPGVFAIADQVIE
jgi:putative tryptophan/tyrosine transport system substrate-binding protein